MRETHILRLVGDTDKPRVILSRGTLSILGGFLFVGTVSLLAFAQNESNQNTDGRPPGSKTSHGYFAGKVLGPGGEPLSGANIYILPNRQEITDLGPLRAVTGEDGTFAFDAADMTYKRLGQTYRREGLIVAKKAGFAPEWMETWGDNTSTLVEYWTPREGAAIELRLATDDVPIRGQFLDAEAKPLADARVRLTRVMVPRNGDLDAHLEHWSKASMFAGFLTKVPDYKRELAHPEQLFDLNHEVRTDADGRFEFTGIGRDRLVRIEVTAPSIVDTTVEVMTRDTDNVGMFLDGNGKPTQTVYGANLTLGLNPGLTATGVVRDRDTKQPIAGMWVSRNYHPLTAPQLTKDDPVTGASGRFTMTGLNPSLVGSRITAVPQPGVQYWMATAMIAQDDDVVIECTRGIHFSLKLVDEQGQAVEATVEYYPIDPNQPSAGLIYPLRAGSNWSTLNRAARQADGTYEGFVLPGPGAVLVKTPSGKYRPTLVDPKAFFEPGKTWDENSFSMYGTHNTLSIGGGWHDQRDYAAILLVNPAKDAQPFELSTTLVADHPRQISLIDSGGQPVTGATAKLHEMRGPYDVDEQIVGATFPLYGLAVNRDQRITFHHDQRKLVGFVSVRGDDDAPLTVTMQPDGVQDLGDIRVDSSDKQTAATNKLATATESEPQATTRTVKYKLVDGPTETPLQGLDVTVAAWGKLPADSPPFTPRPSRDIGSMKSDANGIIAVELRDGESLFVKSMPPGWFLTPAVISPDLPDPNSDEPHVVKLWSGTEVTGRLLWPDGTPATGVRLNAGVYINNQEWKKRLGMDLRMYSFDHGDWANWKHPVATDDRGRFNVTVPPPDARMWLRIGNTPLSFTAITAPSDDDATTGKLSCCIPFEYQIGGFARSDLLTVDGLPENSDQRLPLGDLRLQAGVIVGGQVLDAEGKGLAGVHLTSTGAHGPHSGRKVISGNAGKFEFLAMASGNLTVHPDARLRDEKEQVLSRDVQAVFVDQSFNIPLPTFGPHVLPANATVGHEITIRAVPHTEVVFQWIDRREDKTQPVAYYGAFRVRGYMPDADGRPTTYWTSETERVKRDGKSLLVVKIPTQLLNPELILPADRKVTASYSDSQGVTSGPGIVPLGDITTEVSRTLFGDEPKS